MSVKDWDSNFLVWFYKVTLPQQMIQKQLLEAPSSEQIKNYFALGMVYIVAMLLMVTLPREGVVE